MTKVFLRYFISIFALAVAILMIQMGVLVFQYSVSQEKWKDQVYDDFVVSIENAITDGDFADYGFKTIVYAVSQVDDDRISGFMLRDANSNMVLSFGRAGTDVPQSRRDLVLDGSGSTSPVDVKNGTQINIVTKDSLVQGVERSGLKISVPSTLKNDGIIGSVLVSVDGRKAFYIDLLTFSPRTYQYSKDIINSCLQGILFSIPVCLVIALVVAWIISSRNASYINQVRKALKDLSLGKPDVKIATQTNPDLNEITVAIEDLDKSLQSNAKSRKAWLQSISHDLNTPTTSMKMIIDGLNDGVFPPDSETFRELQRENDTLSERIGRVIDFSTLQADEQPEFGSVDADEFVRDVLSSFNDQERVSADVSCRCIFCDRALMARAVTELLKNAVEANGDSRKPVKLCISESVDSYQITVENSGRIPTDMDTDFFEPWARGDWSRTSGGSGLGLPIASTIVFLHKGSISVKQEDEDLVVATIRWPAS